MHRDAEAAPTLLIAAFTSAAALLTLSERQLIMKPTPPTPYASYVSSLKSAVLGSDPALMLRFTTSAVGRDQGTKSALSHT